MSVTIPESGRAVGVRRSLAAASVVLGALLALPAQSQVASISADVTVEMDGTVAFDEDVAESLVPGVTTTASLGSLPETVEVTAYHRLPGNGDQLISLDTTAELTGAPNFTARHGDVVRYDGADYVMEFEGTANGVPVGAGVDAVSRTAGGDLLLSFDTSVDLGGVYAADEDVVAWNGASFNLVFDGSSQGVPARLDLDAVNDVGNGQLSISFDASGTIAGVTFADEDALLFDPNGPSWTLFYDGSAVHPELAAADVIAVPEPAPVLGLVMGALAMFWLSRTRSDGAAE